MYLTARHIATVRAALLYWQEEMCPNGTGVMRPYLDPPGVRPLSAVEISGVRDLLASGVRYALYRPGQGRLASTELYPTDQVAKSAAGDLAIATVILSGAATHL